MTNGENSMTSTTSEVKPIVEEQQMKPEGTKEVVNAREDVSAASSAEDAKNQLLKLKAAKDALDARERRSAREKKP